MMATLLCLGSQDIRSPRRGGERSVRGSMQALAHSGHRVLYVYPASRPVQHELAPGLQLVGVAAPPREGLRTVLRSFRHGLPYKFAKYHLARVKAVAIAAGRDARAGLLLVHGAHLGHIGLAVRRALGIPAVLRAHNLEYALVSRYAAQLPWPLRPLARWQAELTRRTELALWRAYDRTCFLSDSDLRGAQRWLGAAGRPVCVYDGVRFEDAVRPVPAAGTFLLSAGVDIPQNRAAVSWFLRTVWFPCAAQSVDKNMRLTIIGVAAEELQKRLRLNAGVLASHGVQVKGFVADFGHEVMQHAFFVSPTVFGSGYRVKVAEAGAAGTCMLLTPVDEQSLDFLRDGKNCLVFHDRESFVRAVQTRSGQQAHREQLCRALQDDLRLHMDWKVHAQRLVEGLL